MIVPSLLVFVLVFTTSSVWFGLSCWKTKRWPTSSFAAWVVLYHLHISFFMIPSFLDKIPSSRHTEAARSMMCLTAGMVSIGGCGLCDQSAPISSNLVEEHICSMQHFSQVLLRWLQSGFFLVCSPLLIPSLAKSFTRVLAVVPGSWEHLLLVSFPESLKWFTSSSTVFYLCVVLLEFLDHTSYASFETQW